MTFPLITAHTGCMNQPDNSLQSIQAALQSGADIIEEDITATKDGEAVLFHDDEVRDTSGRYWRISQLTMDELAELVVIPVHSDGTAGMKVVTLEQLLQLGKASGKKLNLDIKDRRSLSRTAELVRNAGMLDQVLLTGCEPQKARYVQKHYPDFTYLLNAEAAPFQRYSYAEAIKLTCEEAKSAGCSGININFNMCREPLIEQAEKYGLPVYVWTVSQTEDMIRFANMGVQSITTRNVPELVRLKQSHLSAGQSR